MAEIQLQKQPSMLNKAMLFMQMQKAHEGDRNAAAKELARSELAAKKQKWTEAKDINEYALNVLSAVSSPEDLDRAKGIFKARYPEKGGLVDQMIPSYTPAGVRLVQDILRTESEELAREKFKWEKTEKLQGFGPGTDIYQGGKKKTSVAPKTDYDVFTDKGGQQYYQKKGDKVPKGAAKLQTSGVSQTVNVDTKGSPTKAMKTQLQKDINSGMKNIASYVKTKELFKPEYLTLFGKGEKTVARGMDKLGISTEDQKTLITERQDWFRRAKADFIAYRKWATGVAGGEKELKEIATSFPDPVENSPTEYQANLDSIEETTKEVLQLNRDFLESGVDFTKPLSEIVKALGLTDVPGAAGGGGDTTIVYERDANGKLVRVKKP